MAILSQILQKKTQFRVDWYKIVLSSKKDLVHLWVVNVTDPRFFVASLEGLELEDTNVTANHHTSHKPVCNDPNRPKTLSLSIQPHIEATPVPPIGHEGVVIDVSAGHSPNF